MGDPYSGGRPSRRLVQGVTQTPFVAALDSKLFKDIKSQIEELERIRTTIQHVLLDGDFKQKKSVMDEAFTFQGWIESLKGILYNIDNLLDEFYTFALQRDTNKVSQKVVRLFSCFNDFVVAFKLCQDLMNIKKKLDAITRDHRSFNLIGFKYKHPRRMMNATGSCVCNEDVIGRHREKEEVVSMLLDKNAKNSVSFVTVVGMGGLGKTTLAQLVYQNDRIISGFEQRSWVPGAIGRLLHLRCLNLSHSAELEILPESITNVINLQVLKLEYCTKLEKFPKKFSRLVNIRHLDIFGCSQLDCMPRGLRNLTCLKRLTNFKVGGNSIEV